jgi:hypothetical protein
MAITTAGTPVNAATQATTALEVPGVEDCENVAELIVRRRAIPERTEAPQQVELLLSKAGDLDKVLGPASTARSASSSTSASGQVTLPLWRGSDKSFKLQRKTVASNAAPSSVAAKTVAILRESNERIATDSAPRRFVTLFVHPIGLGNVRLPLPRLRGSPS